ncbi:hypothetical protein GCM10011344_41100 [Dokdonia pacifica]|uniref:Uncharacterized protein n=1 Tax=Dokdonia pacifica TaxID=1627892 RepID=A0A239AD59_9FLAO|nr:hypothetical protein [Dokdonia pacifica]GGG35971.1 hypothetical protein GCM10011344_41100 [Dokdonia pacifica]SNR92843.1 hypothetical protein SAMN06265376_104296 [Dokdonia pacifica]
MKKITHESYINKHALDIALLPSDVQQKIGVFEKMLALEETIEKHDEQELENRLFALDKEITDELKELKPLYKTYQSDHNITKQDNPKQEKLKISDDQTILAQLVASKKNKSVMLSSLRALGFKGELGKVTIFGKYRITRVSFCFYCYTITEIVK